MEGAKKASVWLGLATAVITVLAFFGITNFQQLKHAVAAPSPPDNRAACTVAMKAWHVEAVMYPLPSAAVRMFAAQIRQAAPRADSTLQSFMLSSAADEERRAALMDSGSDGNSVPTTNTGAWIDVCLALGIGTK